MDPMVWIVFGFLWLAMAARQFVLGQNWLGTVSACAGILNIVAAVSQYA